MNDFRALCAELADAWNAQYGETSADVLDRLDPIIDRARAALAEGDGAGPTDEALCEFFRANEDLSRHCEAGTDWDEPLMMKYEFPAVARAVLARYGNTNPSPIPVAERLPTAVDCDDKGRCWFLYRIGGIGWDLIDRAEVTGPAIWCCWLPATAIPMPEIEQ